MCDSIFSTQFVQYISHSKKNSARFYQMYIAVNAKQLLFLCDFIDTWNLSNVFRNIVKYQISGKSAPWEQSCSVLTADGQTDGHDGAKRSFMQFFERA